MGSYIFSRATSYSFKNAIQKQKTKTNKSLLSNLKRAFSPSAETTVSVFSHHQEGQPIREHHQDTTILKRFIEHLIVVGQDKMTARLANNHSTKHRRHGRRFLWYSSALLLTASSLFLMNRHSDHTTLLIEKAKQNDVVYVIRRINVNHNDTNNGNGNGNGNDKIVDETFSTSTVSSADIDAKGSALLLLKAATEPRLVFDEAIDIVTERSRCERYNLTLLPSSALQLPPKRRRIFWGSLIADDSWHAIAMIAMETYGIFHTAAFVESNRTQNFSSRKLRFPPGSKMKSFLQSGGLFGPSSYSSSSTSPNMSSTTKVSVDYFVNENDRLKDLNREQEQRALILERWKANGMTGDDIGYLSDVDETFSRDFIRAMQICDVPAFRQADTFGNCSKPKVLSGSNIIFEGSPLCIPERKRWFHPDMVCVVVVF